MIRHSAPRISGMQEGRWTTITPSQFAHEREALAHVQALLPDSEPYRAW